MQWTEILMSAALDAVLNNQLLGNKATALHGLPLSTLKDRLSGRVTHGESQVISHTQLSRRKRNLQIT